MLQELGCEVVGPVSRIDDAIRLAESESLDGAIVDVELQDGTAFPVADRLLERGVPFVFATGFSEAGFFAAPYDAQPRLQKPFDLERVREVIGRFGSSRSRGGSGGRTG